MVGASDVGMWERREGCTPPGQCRWCPARPCCVALSAPPQTGRGRAAAGAVVRVACSLASGHPAAPRRGHGAGRVSGRDAVGARSSGRARVRAYVSSKRTVRFSTYVVPVSPTWTAGRDGDLASLAGQHSRGGAPLPATGSQDKASATPTLRAGYGAYWCVLRECSARSVEREGWTTRPSTMLVIAKRGSSTRSSLFKAPLQWRPDIYPREGFLSIHTTR